jgi:hypothetical protein
MAAIASSAVHEHLPEVPNPVPPSLQPKQPPSSTDFVLRQNGIEPGSEKARILLEWFERIRRNPAIQRRIPGGVEALHQVLSDTNRRDSLMRNGLVRLSASDRLRYLKIYTRIVDNLVPVNCFGMSDMGDVLDRIALGAMDAADVAEYLDLLYKVIVSSTSTAPVRTPTLRQYKLAEAKLTQALMLVMGRDQHQIDRYQFYALHPFAATPADMCWATRVTLHAIGAMPDPYRDYILLPAITGSGYTAPAHDDKSGSP